MFGEIVSPVGMARPPENMELALVFVIAEPVKAHVHSLGAFLFDRVIDDPTGSVVVSLQGSGRLEMAQFFQGGADGADGLGIEEQGTQFSFSSTGDDLSHDLAENMDGAIARGAGSVAVGGEWGHKLKKAYPAACEWPFGVVR